MGTVIYRSPDDVAEAEAIQAERRTVTIEVPVGYSVFVFKVPEEED